MYIGLLKSGSSQKKFTIDEKGQEGETVLHF